MDPSHSLPLPAYDRDIGLEELLSGLNRDSMLACLNGLAESTVCLESDTGEIVLGEKPHGSLQRLPLRTELEVIGYLVVADEVKNAGVLTNLVEILLRSAARYIMTSNIHIETVQEDYEELQLKHQALQESEQRYKELSETLEQRVQEQVKTIEFAQLQLYQSEKMAAVGQLAAGMAHEINNPVGFIVSNLNTAGIYVDRISKFGAAVKESSSAVQIESAWKECKMDHVLEDFPSLIIESNEGAQRITSIIKNLKVFSNVDNSEEAITSINDCINNVCAIFKNDLPIEVKLNLQLEQVPLSRFQPGYIQQAFLNVLKNAAQAITGPGEITILTTSSDGKIILQVSDTGIGIPESSLGRVFDPFYTLREIGDGVGLGLTVCRDIVHQHEGDISVDSVQGQGTTVTINFPVRNKE